MKQQIQELLSATPFRPFNIHMSDGRFFGIDHPEIVFATTNPLTPVVVEIGRLQHHLSPRAIVSIDLQAAES